MEPSKGGCEVSHSKPLIAKEDLRVVGEFLGSGMIAEGETTRQFEKAVAAYLGLAGGVATATGTDALFLALKALNVGDGAEVILPTYVCSSVKGAVLRTGADPVLCDVGDDWCMNVHTVLARVTPLTRAIVVVHTFGIMADIKPILSLGIPVVEDCCQALGSQRSGTMAGTLGKACVCSFHATKLLTTGEGGMVLTGDQGVYERLRELAREHRSPLSNLQAALGLSQFSRYEQFLNRRRVLAEYYFQRLADLAMCLPWEVRDRSIFFRFPIRTRKGFEEVQQAFAAVGIHVRRGVDALLHRMAGAEDVGFEGAVRCFTETVSLPLYPALGWPEAEQVVAAARRILA